MIDHPVYIDYGEIDPSPGWFIGELIMPPISGEAFAARRAKLLAKGFVLQNDRGDMAFQLGQDDGCPVCSCHDRAAYFFERGDKPKKLEILPYIECHSCGSVQLINLVRGIW